MTKLSLPTLCVLVCSTVVNAADNLVPFRFFKEIGREAWAEEEIVGVILDSDVYAATHEGLPDIRIVDDQDNDSPFILQVVSESKSKTVRKTETSKVLSLTKIENDGVEIIVRRKEKTKLTAERFRIVTPLKNFERHVWVFGSQDGGEWSPLVEDAFVFDYSEIIDVHNDEIILPKNDFRQFKFVFDHITNDQDSPFQEITRKLRDGQEVEKWERHKAQRRAFRIERIEYSQDVVREKRRGNKTTGYSVAEFKTKEDSEEKQAIILLRMRREPLTGFRLKTTSHNFNRRVVVQVPSKIDSGLDAVREEFGEQDVVRKWENVGEAIISDVSFRNYHREQLEINFPEQRMGKYRIVIHNEDNPPLEVTAIEARGHVKRVVFRASQDTAYRLFYGSETTKLPSYETEPLKEMMNQGFPVTKSNAGTQIENPEYGDDVAPMTLLKFLNNKVFLGGAIVLMVIVLGWVLVRAGGRINEIPPA